MMKLLLLCLSTFCTAWSGSLHAQNLFKWTDPTGKIVYSDQPPPANARNVEEKRSQASVIENNQSSSAASNAQKNNPVILYTTKCGDFCDKGTAYLNKRGVPHAVVDPSQPSEFEKFKSMTGGTRVPVLKVGEGVFIGFEEAAWAGALDKAGYSKVAAYQGSKLSPLAQANQSANANANTLKDANHPMVQQLSTVYREHVNTAKKGEVNPYLSTLDAESRSKISALDADALKKQGALMCDPALAQFVQMDYKFNAARLVYTQRIGANQHACGIKLIDENNKWKIAQRESEAQEAEKDPKPLLDKILNSAKGKL
jgi:glutaredoxin